MAFSSLVRSAQIMLDRGRRVAFAYTVAFYLTGPAIMGLSTSVGGLALGRFILGMGFGSSAVVVPAYVGEMAPPASRGRIVILYEVMTSLGMIAAALADFFFEIRETQLAMDGKKNHEFVYCSGERVCA